jgi:hypothetical protein
MPVKVTITRQTMGEVLCTEILECNPVTGESDYPSREAMQEVFDYCSKLTDERVYTINMRTLGIKQLREFFTPEEWFKVEGVVRVLCGEMTLGQLIANWQAIQEENRALEGGRRSQQPSKYCPYCDTMQPLEWFYITDDDQLGQKCEQCKEASFANGTGE